MNTKELDVFLKKYTQDELIYKEYYYVKDDKKAYKEFIKNLDRELIIAKNILIPEVNDFFTYLPEENLFFNEKTTYNIFVTKHYRYTPTFNHKHAFFEMLYVYSGSCKQNIGGTDIILNTGDICIVSPEIEHSVSVFDDSIIIDVLIKKSTFNDTFLEVLSDENILSSFFMKILYTKQYNNYIIFKNNNSNVTDTMLNILIESIENKKYCNKVLDNLLMILFAYLLRDEKNTVELPNELHKSTKHMSSILTYMQSNYKTVTLEELSNNFHFTVPYLSKLIKTNTGHNFKQIIQTIKLNKAIELLTYSTLKIHDISDILGYENSTHFIRTFKKVYNLSPTEYKKSIRK
ncbi:AraC family transcriptional regulator [Clostridium felsineum]|uniref:AraC family transcriptional regulator n=1 Tax=Clostridium felsineum TaxID=36839 RepID=UPI00098C8E9B|nr:AraC family transcriptional regulator [Clostridium felsineum]URZ02245.1 HTH-type transcriptional activator RhaS [Clostridium felsineum]